MLDRVASAGPILSDLGDVRARVQHRARRRRATSAAVAVLAVGLTVGGLVIGIRARGGRPATVGPASSVSPSSSTPTVVSTTEPLTSSSTASPTPAPTTVPRPTPTDIVAPPIASPGAVEPVVLTAAGYVRTSASPEASFDVGADVVRRVEIFREAGQGLGDPGILVRTANDGCTPGMAVEGLQGKDPAVFELGSSIQSKHCVRSVTVEVIGDRVDRATIDGVLAAIRVNPDGVVTELGDARYRSAGVREPLSTGTSWAFGYEGQGNQRVTVAATSRIISGWRLALDQLFFVDPRNQHLVDVNGHRAVVVEGDTATMSVTWFEGPFLTVSVSGVFLNPDDLLSVARSVQLAQNPDDVFLWPTGPGGFVPTHYPDPTAFGDKDYAPTAGNTVICRYRDLGAKGGWMPFCTPLSGDTGYLLSGVIGQVLLVRVPAAADRLVDPATGRDIAHTDTGIVTPGGERVWEAHPEPLGDTRNIRIIDLAGRTVRCASEAAIEC